MGEAEREEFWQETEKEIGEEVLSYAMGSYYPGHKRDAQLFGLLFISASAIHFRHFSQRSFLQVGKAPKEVRFSVMLGGKRLVVPQKLSGLRALFAGPSSRVFKLVGNQDDKPAYEAEFPFTVENNESDFIDTLLDLVEGVEEADA